MKHTFQVFSEDDLERIHALSLKILADPGMRILSPALRSALEQHGARVDHASGTVRFPAQLVEETIAAMQAELARRGLTGEVRVVQTGCRGRLHQGQKPHKNRSSRATRRLTVSNARLISMFETCV